MARKIVKYKFEEPVDGIDVAYFEVGTITLAELGQHAKLRRLYDEAWEKRNGIVLGDLTQKEYDALDPDIVSLRGLWSRWARIQTSLRTIRAALGDETIEVDLSLFGWDNVDGLDGLPVDLFETLDVAAIQCNPRVFGAYIPDEVDPKNEKAVGVLSVS